MFSPEFTPPPKLIYPHIRESARLDHKLLPSRKQRHAWHTRRRQLMRVRIARLHEARKRSREAIIYESLRLLNWIDLIPL